MRLAHMHQFSFWNYPTTCKFLEISLMQKAKWNIERSLFQNLPSIVFLGGGACFLFQSTSFCSLFIGSQGGGLLDWLLLFIKLASFRKIFKPTVVNTGKCLLMLHLCSEGRSLAYKNKQENLGNNTFIKRDRPDSQHWKFSGTRDCYFCGFTEP